jgi:GNAT superfamily N-acetyltransferase
VRPWTDEQVWAAVHSWRWVPPGATKIATDAFELAVTPGMYSLTFVYGFREEDPDRVDERLAEVRERIERAGGTGARFQVTPRSRPEDLPARLLRYGYRHRDTTDVLAWELKDAEDRPRLPPPGAPEGVEVREATTEAEFDEFIGLAAPIFGDPPVAGEIRTRFREETARQLREWGHSGRFLARIGPRAVGRAGLDVEGPVAQLWGTGVLEEHRHRGIYRALVRARSESALAQGAEIAIVTARVGTSGPILKRLGYRKVGEIQVFETRWDTDASAGIA